jgi:hypothetical protein
MFETISITSCCCASHPPGGQAPFLAAYEADEHASRSTLGLLADYASSLTSGVLSAATSVAAAGPNLLKAGRRIRGCNLAPTCLAVSTQAALGVKTKWRFFKQRF